MSHGSRGQSPSGEPGNVAGLVSPAKEKYNNTTIQDASRTEPGGTLDVVLGGADARPAPYSQLKWF